MVNMCRMKTKHNICTGEDYEGYQYKNINVFIIIFTIISFSYIIPSVVIIALHFQMIIECLLKNIWAFNLLSVVTALISTGGIIGIVRIMKYYDNIVYVAYHYCIIYFLVYISVMVWGGIELFMNLHTNPYTGCFNHPVCYDVKNSTIVTLGYVSFSYDICISIVCVIIPLLYGESTPRLFRRKD